MSDNIETMSFDLKKSRIRIHKSTIRAVGDPKYLDLLVNPVKRLVAVKAHDNATPKKDAHRVKQHLMESDNSYEIYSQPFMNKLLEVTGELEKNCSYRITGRFIPSEKMVVYSLDTITRIES